MNVDCWYSVAFINVAAGNNLMDMFLYLCTFSFKIVRLLDRCVWNLFSVKKLEFKKLDLIMSPFYLKLSMALSTELGAVISGVHLMFILRHLSRVWQHISPGFPCSSRARPSSVHGIFSTEGTGSFSFAWNFFFFFFLSCCSSSLSFFRVCIKHHLFHEILLAWVCRFSWERQKSLKNSVCPSHVTTAISFLKFWSWVLDFPVVRLAC